MIVRQKKVRSVTYNRYMYINVKYCQYFLTHISHLLHACSNVRNTINFQPYKLCMLAFYINKNGCWVDVDGLTDTTAFEHKILGFEKTSRPQDSSMHKARRLQS